VLVIKDRASWLDRAISINLLGPLHLTERHLKGPGLRGQYLRLAKEAAQGLWTQTPSQGRVWDIAGTRRLLAGWRRAH
jgi:hypothetical protein